MELHELPEDKDIKIFGLEPNGDKDGVVIFGHVDGMYSYCWVEGQPDKICNLNASTELAAVEGGYRLKEEDNEEV